MPNTDDPWEKVQSRIAACQRYGGMDLVLNGMDLSDADFSSRVFAHVVKKLPSLQTLQLENTDVGDTGLIALANQAKHLSSLQTLHMNCRQIGDEGLIALANQAKQLSRLQTLNLSCTNVGDEGLIALANQAEQFRCLQELSLERTLVGDVGLVVLANQTEHLSSLQTLHVNGTQIGDEGLIALANHAKHLSSLQTLNLSRTEVGNEGMIALANQAEHLSNLRNLYLYLTQIGDEGLIALANQAKQLSSLRTLDLSGTEVGNEGLIALAYQAEYFGCLRRLEIRDTQVEDDGLIALANQAKHLSSLQTLVLSGTEVGNEGLIALANQAEHLGCLRGLELRDTQVGNDGLIALANQAKYLSNLQELHLKETLVDCVSPEVLQTHNAKVTFEAVLRGHAVAEAKVVVLGEPAVGKSWLCQRFFRGEIPTGERTETHDFELIRPEWRPTVGTLPIDLHVWDFGGQHVLHGTHEMFLTQRSVCLLVLDVTQVRERDDRSVDPERRGNRLTYWLKMIRHFVGLDAHVILVVTQCDRLIGTDDKPPEPERLGKIDPERLQIDFGFTSPIKVVPTFSAKAEDDATLEPLRVAITDAIDKLEVHSRVGRKLRDVKKQVQAKIQGRTLVSLSEYRTWCEAESVTDRDSQDSILKTLHHFGSVFYFGLLKFEQERQERGFPSSSDDLPPGQRRLLTAPRDSCLKDWLINPVWLKFPVFEVMRASERKPELSENDIEEAVEYITRKEKLESHPQGTAVVQAVLLLNELCLHDQGTGKWFFPRGLPIDSDVTDWGEEVTESLNWGFFPEAAIHRFLVQSIARHEVVKRPKSGKPACWRTGAVLEINGAKGVIESEPESGLVTVRLRKTDDPEKARLNETFLNRVRGRLEDLIGREPDKEERSRKTNPPAEESAADHPSPEMATNSAETLPAQTANPTPNNVGKKAGEKENLVKQFDALAKHHKYQRRKKSHADQEVSADWACVVGLSCVALQVRELKVFAGVRSTSTVSKFLLNQFGGHAAYVTICQKKDRVALYKKLEKIENDANRYRVELIAMPESEPRSDSAT